MKAGIAPYRDVITFVITLLASNYIWKLTILGEEEGAGYVTWLNLVDLTPVFNAYAAHIADCVYAFCSTFRDTIHMVNDYTLRWETGSGTRIVWSCTPLKQSFIWLCLMLTTPWVKCVGRERWKTIGIRLGWIATGLVVIHAFNILRISLITLALENHADWFELLHTYIFKYIFYGIMFLLWVIYVEKIRD